MRFLNLVSLMGLTAVSASTVAPRVCPSPYSSFTYTQTFGYDASNGIVTGTFTPSSGQSLSLSFVQLHASTNCAAYIDNTAGQPSDDQYSGTTPVTLSSSSGACSTEWYQPPFDTTYALNYQAGSNGTASNPQDGVHAVYIATNNTYVFHMAASVLNFNPASDTLCYDFTYAFTSGTQCDTGICVPQATTTAPSTSPIVVGIRGDPQFAGFQGQSFQVHGVAGNIYNLFSSSNLQVNGEFVFLDQGHCDPSMNTLCYGHPGSYIGALGLVYGDASANKTQILIQSGKWNAGLHIHVDNREVHVTKYNVNVAFSNGLVLRYISKSKVHIRTPILSVVVTNSDRFLNLDMDLNDKFLTTKAINTCQWPSVNATAAGAFATEPRGLMGQTWCLRAMDSHNLEEQIDDYTQETLFSQ